MKTYLIRGSGGNDFDAFEVEAENYTEAATKASHKLNGERTRGLRITGKTSMSGVFQGYRDASQSAETSVGGNFHVSEL